MVQYIVWEALAYNKSDLPKINKFFAEKEWGKVRYIMTIKTLPGRGQGGGRTDVVFAMTPGKKYSSFFIQRLQMDIKWLGDYVNNNRDIIPAAQLNKLRKMVKQSGDYEEVKEEEDE